IHLFVHQGNRLFFTEFMANQKRDYYEVLGVERTATLEVISQSYRKLAMKYHPDRNPGDQEAIAKFKEAAEAFDVLSNPEKRATYDRYGHQGVHGMPGGGATFHDINDIFEAFGDILGGGIFGDIFGGGRGGTSRRARRGEDIRCVVKLDLREVATGVKKTIRLRREEVCTTCHGSGSRPGTAPEPCSYCGGRGHVVQQAGFLRMQSTCPACHGSGKIIRQPCSTCRGSGLFTTEVEREIDIPAGIDERTQLRISGEGSQSLQGGEPGDCFVTIQFAEHPVFQVDGKDLVCRVPITYSQAVLGAEMEIPSLEGREELRIPPGTQHGDIFRIKGKGLPYMRSERRGDILVIVQLEVPRTITEEYEKLIRQVAELEKSHVSPQRKGFFKRIASYLQSMVNPEEEQEKEKDS
ncbi:MAG: molecular chaperone DnaJ, partial [Planctomycetia bacterium]|nr:molecular chaperone DnaJ [Planctomycetia bacterium]